MLEESSPNPPTAPAPAPASAPPSAVRPLSPEDLTFWRAEIDRARTLRNDVIARWDSVGNLERYTPESVKTNNLLDARVNVAKDFSDVERKKAALFYDTPEIALVPDPGTDGSLLPLHAEFLNTLLSSTQMDAKATVLPTIQDCLVALQPVPTEIGYNSVTVQVEQPVVDPMTGQPAIDPMTGAPQMQSVPVIVWEEFFWRRVSPKAQLIPVQMRDTIYDRAPWLAFEWRKPLSQVRRQFTLPETFTGGGDSGRERPYFQPIGAPSEDSEPMVSGVKLWYRAAFRDPEVTHPEIIRELELIEGYDLPVVHRDSPYQSVNPQTGRLTPDSITGYPDHPLALRDLTDSPYVAADCTLTGPLTRELNKSRTTNIQQRDGSKLHVFYDPSKVNEDVRSQIEQGDAPTMIPVMPGALDGGTERMMAQVPALQQSRDSFTTQQIIEHDRADILGINSNTVGGNSRGSKTATEVQNVQRNTDARFEQERQRVLEWWIKGVQKLSALVLRYGDRLALDILGPQRGAQWAQSKAQFGPFSFEVVIDSGNYTDIESRKRQDLQLYNLTAKDPTLNRSVVQARLATDFGLNPAEWLITKQPEEKPEAPTVSIAVKPEDLDPALPSYVGTYAILTAGGVKGLPPPQPMMGMAPPPQQPNQPGHGGMAELTPRLNQHQMDESGANPGPAVN